MTADTRGAIADVAALGAAAIAVYLIARNPPLRRGVARALKYGLFTAAPRLLWQETTRAWALSGMNLESRIPNQE